MPGRLWRGVRTRALAVVTRSPNSWGRFPSSPSASRLLHWPDEPWPGAGSLLPHGLGRSYGDVCLSAGGTLLLTRGLNRLLAFERQLGVVTCESGVSLDEILHLIVPAGWFLPVTPGTRFVTVGGAIANDVHGKNHHVAGSFGAHVDWFDLRRSDGNTLRCSLAEHEGLFRATIGGLGLTGVIVRAAFRLVRIPSPWLRQDAIPFAGLEEFLALSSDSAGWPYTVAWIDCFRARAAIPGIFFRGEFTEGPPIQWDASRLAVPFDAPGWLLNPATMGAFNRVYHRLQSSRRPGARSWVN